MQFLYNGIRKDAINELFDNISLIIFNYDRCVEHLIYHAIQNYYAIDANRAAVLMQSLEIFHPYGVVGRLPFQSAKDAVPFGSGANQPKKLLSLASQIKTYSERIEEESAVAGIRQIVQNAEIIVFLGFAFHGQNMDLIQPTKPGGYSLFC